MVTARLLTNCSNTLRNIHTNARENIARTRAKRKAGYFFVAHPVFIYLFIYLYGLYIYPTITMADLIAPLSIYLLGNLHLPQTVGGIKLSGRKFILSAKVKGLVLAIGVLYDTSVTVLLFV